MSHLSLHDLCLEHGLTSFESVWVKATDLSEAGDRALLSYLLDNDAEYQFSKVQRAAEAQERARRAAMTREQLLEEFGRVNTCVCQPAGRCYGLMKDILQRKSLDGELQRTVLEAFRAGRAKMRNVCLIGGPDCGKSFSSRGSGKSLLLTSDLTGAPIRTVVYSGRPARQRRATLVWRPLRSRDAAHLYQLSP